MLSSKNKKDITNLFESISNEEEFEVMFNNYKSDNTLSLIDFMNVLKYTKYRSDLNKLEYKEAISLDINYGEYRISINGLANINNILGLLYQRKNNNIFSIIVGQYLDKEGFKLIKKIKERSNIIDIDTMDIRVRKSKEMPITDSSILKTLSKVSSLDADKIMFRYKQRLSLKLMDDLHVDLTIIKTNVDINHLLNSVKTYEIEIDYSPTKLNQSALNIILDEMITIKKVIMCSDHFITKEDSQEIITKYKSMTYGNGSSIDINMLYSMQPISAEVQHIVDYIPNKYSASDKADGEKNQLFIHNGEAYLISNNLHVKKMGIKIDNMDNTIVEGELIYIDEKRVFLFMMWDCLYYMNEDIREKTQLKERLGYLEKISKGFKVSPYVVKDYTGKFELNDIHKYYTKNITQFYSSLNKEMNLLKPNQVLVYPKIFLFPSGGSPSEVFLFSEIIWNSCTKNINIECPYMLDGIILTPIDQKYTRERKEQRQPIYKYKPPQTNSLDVYIMFERNKETGGYMDVFDNSLPNKLEFKTYRVINLFVGEAMGSREQPIPFMKEQNNSIIYLPVIDGNVRDIEGNIILDKTVVEVIYTNDTTMPHPYRWNVLKTRWDKTDTVMRFNKRYGNNKDVAEKVWKSMIESVTIEEINNLSQPKTYDMQMKLLASRLNTSVISSQRKQDIYYQKITNLCHKMRDFNNWIKSIIFINYCSPSATTIGGKNVRQTLLDFGCGRGGDVEKMYFARIAEYVGFDPDFENIYSASDSIYTRYNKSKAKFPDFYRGTFFQADGGIVLDLEHQLKAFPNMSKENIKSIERALPKDKQFDIINSQFAIHYLFKDNTSINNMIHNIKTYLKKDGYVLLTLFDPATIVSSFDETGKITSYYTDDEGKRSILYEIVKKYSGDFNPKVSNPIDVHMAWIMEEGKHIEEYLVSRELMVDTMEKAGCRLIDTDLFSNVFNLNRPYFENVIQYEENPKNKQYYERIASFFGDLKGADKESRNYTFLFRYYIFQKME